MSFNDDEPIVAGPQPTPIKDGRVDLVSKRGKDKAPLEENIQTVMLQLTADGYSGDRGGLDLVAVLDISGSMADFDKIGKMKKAMQFVIKKLGPIDRLCIVSFSGAAKRLCPLRQITEASQAELQRLIDGLGAGGATNISDGLSTGLKVLADRKFSADRVPSIMLMSDGKLSAGFSDPAQVAIGNVPVYTFGFGADYDANVLNAVAKKSKGGTFSVINDIDGLSVAFSQILGGLLTAVVRDLTVTLTRSEGDSTIKKVTAGDYLQTPGTDGRSVIVSFGDLYSKEVRTIIVELLLPPTEIRVTVDILTIEFTYRIRNVVNVIKGRTQIVSMLRTSNADPEDDQPAPALQAELARQDMVTKIKAARNMADGQKLGDARDKLVEAQNALEDVLDQSNPLLDMLRTELQQLLKLLKSQDVYNKQGRPYALSAETSHDRQRFAARGDVESLRLFATPRMDTYLEQAKKFDENPTAPLPSVDDDVKEELAANPLGPIAGPVTFYIQTAIQALQAIANLINNGGKP